MKYRALFIGLLILVFLSSCVTRRYIHNPVAVNNPFFTQKNDSKLGAYVSGGFSNSDSNYNRGFDLLSAYAISNHVALTANYFHRRERNFYDRYYNGPFDTSLVSYSRSGWEAGAGYFLPLDPGKHISLNLYGGIGNGSLLIKENGFSGGASYTRFHQSSPFKIYVQPSLNLMSSVVQFGVAYRFNYIRFKNIQTDYLADEQDGLKLSGLQDRTVLFRELAFDLQLSLPELEWLAFDSQVSFCTNIGHYQARVGNASAGLSVDLYKLLKKH